MSVWLDGPARIRENSCDHSSTLLLRCRPPALFPRRRAPHRSVGLSQRVVPISILNCAPDKSIGFPPPKTQNGILTTT